MMKAFTPSYIELVNESGGHNVAPGSETHFKLVIVSTVFEGMKRVARHQAVYRLLSAERDKGLHALAIHAYSPEEWLSRGGVVHPSPDCRGGTGL